MWKYTGKTRPEFADPPATGQESVWDYPRPPRVVPDGRLVEVRFKDELIASSRSAIKVLETASPPTFYVSPADVAMDLLETTSGRSYCEWKGSAQYWELVGYAQLGAVGWSYEEPHASFAALRSWLSFYPARIECFVDGERVMPQPGGFYGGWLTREIVGPVKGGRGTGHW